MNEWIQANDTLLWWLAALSAMTFLATLIAVPMLVVRLPSDYFSYRKRRRAPWADQHPAVRLTLLVAKNTLGGVFVVCGIAMLLLPGQGILTILIGVVLLDFPGKYRLQRWVVGHGPVFRSINWLRRRRGREPIALDDECES